MPGSSTPLALLLGLGCLAAAMDAVTVTRAHKPETMLWPAPSNAPLDQHAGRHRYPSGSNRRDLERLKAGGRALAGTELPQSTLHGRLSQHSPDTLLEPCGHTIGTFEYNTVEGLRDELQVTAHNWIWQCLVLALI